MDEERRETIISLIMTIWLILGSLLAHAALYGYIYWQSSSIIRICETNKLSQIECGKFFSDPDYHFPSITITFP